MRYAETDQQNTEESTILIPVWVLVIVLHADIETVAYYPHNPFGYAQCEIDKARAEKYFLTKFSCTEMGTV